MSIRIRGSIAAAFVCVRRFPLESEVFRAIAFLFLKFKLRRGGRKVTEATVAAAAIGSAAQAGMRRQRIAPDRGPVVLCVSGAA